VKCIFNMEPKVMNLERAILNCDFPEFALVLMWQSWSCYTDIDLDALEYLVKHSSKILLPNVKILAEAKKLILKDYKGHLLIGINI